MMKNKIKIEFFENEIGHLLEFKQSFEQLSKFLRVALTYNNVQNQMNALMTANEAFKEDINIIKMEIQNTKTESDLYYDQAKIEQRNIFRSLDDKIDQLNERLYAAENGVQYAETLKKEKDALNAEYQMANYKNIKKESQKNVIHPYIQFQNKVINEFKRSINLMLKISERKNKKITHQNSQILKLLKMRANGMSYRQMRRSQVFGSCRKALSEEKKIISQLEHKNRKNKVDNRKKKEPLISVLLKSPHIRYKDERVAALSSLTLRLKQNNKAESKIIQTIKNGIELKNRDQVRKYLESKQQLNEEECLMKIQLMSSKLLENIQQRFLSLKLKSKPSFEFNEGENIIQQWQIDRRAVKSLQKLWNNQSIQSSKKKNGKKLSLTHQFMAKPSNSNPKTTDSSKNELAF